MTQSGHTAAAEARQQLRDGIATSAQPGELHLALGLLAGWMDLSTPRPTAVWLVVPQLHGNIGPMVDGHSLPLTAPNQYVSVPRDWIDTYHRTPAPEGHPA